MTWECMCTLYRGKNKRNQSFIVNRAYKNIERTRVI